MNAIITTTYVHPPRAGNPTFKKYWLVIDNEKCVYTVWYKDSSLKKEQTKLAFKHNDYGDIQSYQLPITIPMDENNPAKTIETFYKILMLQ